VMAIDIPIVRNALRTIVMVVSFRLPALKA
jgi:hypothetical protein